MSRSRATRRRAQRPAPRASRSRWRAPAIWIVATALVVAATVLWLGRPSRPTAPPARDPIATMSLEAAYAEASRLGEQGHHTRALPYYRRVAEILETNRQARLNLGAAYANSALEVVSRLGYSGPALRSSFERIASLRAGLAEDRRALALSDTPHDRASVAFAEAQVYFNWGLPLDALIAARIARTLDPSWDAPARLILDIEHRLEEAQGTR